MIGMEVRDQHGVDALGVTPARRGDDAPQEPRPPPEDGVRQDARAVHLDQHGGVTNPCQLHASFGAWAHRRVIVG